MPCIAGRLREAGGVVAKGLEVLEGMAAEKVELRGTTKEKLRDMLRWNCSLNIRPRTMHKSS